MAKFIQSVTEALVAVISWFGMILKAFGSWFSPSEWSIFWLALGVIASVKAAFKRWLR